MHMGSNGLTAARDQLAGLPQRSGISGGTPDSNKYIKVDHRNLVIMMTMGLAIITHSLKEASYVYAGTSTYDHNKFRHSKLAMQALAFIEGTGLDITIQRFGLDLNAHNIREEFHRKFHG